MTEEKQKMSNKVNNQEQEQSASPDPSQGGQPIQPQQKPKFPTWLSVLGIVIAAVIVLGLVAWGGYELFKSAPSELPEAEDVEEDEFKDWKTYQNEEYGFEMSLTDSWKNYRTFIRSDYGRPNIKYIYFMVPTNDEKWSGEIEGYAAPMAIGIYSISEWLVVQGQEGPKSRYIAENNDYVFGYGTWQDSPSDLRDVDFGIDQILSTFKFIEPNEVSKILNIQGIEMTIFDEWYIDRQTETKVYIKTNYQPHNVFLVLDVKKNNQDDIKWYKEERNGYDYTKIENGEIFKIACGGALACNGVIMDNNVYTFGWTIESDQPAPEDLEGIWAPDHNVTQEDIWNILKTIED